MQIIINFLVLLERNILRCGRPQSNFRSGGSRHVIQLRTSVSFIAPPRFGNWAVAIISTLRRQLSVCLCICLALEKANTHSYIKYRCQRIRRMRLKRERLRSSNEKLPHIHHNSIVSLPPHRASAPVSFLLQNFILFLVLTMRTTLFGPIYN